MALLLAVALMVLAFPAGAVDQPVRDPNLLRDPVEEEVVRVQGAKVVLADYDLIRRDFPSTRNMSEPEIDAWLLRYTAFIAKPQAAQLATNTPIPTTSETTKAFRPDQYRRALVFQAGDEGLIDAKGAGSLKPVLVGHQDGLATLGEGIREYVYEKLIRRILEESGAKTSTVGTYAVLDLGFNVIHTDHSQSPAGLILRQSHQRLPSQASGFNDKSSLELEKLFRHFGITSAGAYRYEPVERINIQGTPQGDIVDFGGFLGVEKFSKPARNFHGTVNLLVPGQGDFPQPQESLRAPFSLWGYTVSGKDDPKLDNPWIWSHELAQSLRNGTATRADANQHIRNLLGPVEEKLERIPKPNPHVPCPKLFVQIY